MPIRLERPNSAQDLGQVLQIFSYCIAFVEEDQRASAIKMQELCITEVVGWLKDLSGEQIRDSYTCLSRDHQQREMFSQRGWSELDGLGAKRVANACLESVVKRFG